MFRYVRDCRVILFVLGLLPSVIVNLSTNYHAEPVNDDLVLQDSVRILPGADKHQLESPPPLQEEDYHQSNHGQQYANDKDHRHYQLIGLSQYHPRFNGTELFLSKQNVSQSNKADDVTGDRRWIKKMFGKGLKKRKLADKDLLPRKLVKGYEAKDQLSIDDGRRGNVRRPLQDNNSDLRSGYYYDSYGDWHHSGGDTGALTLTGAGSGYFGSGGLGHNQHSGVANGHSYGIGHHLLGWHFLNPLILVAALSFVISLINAVLGVVDRLKLPVVRTLGERPQYSRVVDDDFLNELGKLYDSVHRAKRCV